MKNLIFILTTIFISTSANSQISIYLEGGANQGKSVFPDFEEIETSNKYGYYFAVIPQLNIWKNISVNGEFQYSLEGFQGANDLTSDLEYKYIRFIPAVDYKILDLVNVFAGVDLGYNFSVSYRSNGFDWTKAPNTSKGIKDFDFGVIAGARVEVKRFSFVIKYNFGVYNIGDFVLTDANGIGIGTPIQKNRVLQFGLAYRFQLI